MKDLTKKSPTEGPERIVSIGWILWETLSQSARGDSELYASK